jgi:hypothetical protein
MPNCLHELYHREVPFLGNGLMTRASQSELAPDLNDIARPVKD